MNVLEWLGLAAYACTVIFLICRTCWRRRKQTDPTTAKHDAIITAYADLGITQVENYLKEAADQ